MTDISVIIVSWNARDYLRKCLLSVNAASAGLQVETIVVDNASSDGSPEMVQRDFPFVKMVQTGENLGFAGGNNRGISCATGRYLFLINSDVEVYPDTFSRFVDFLDRQSEIGLAGPMILSKDGSIQRSCMAFPSLGNSLYRALGLDRVFPRSPRFGSQLMTYWDHRSTRDVDIVNGCFWAARADAVNEVGGLDSRFFMYGEDVDWCRRFHQHGWRVVFNPDVRVIHYGAASSSNAPQKYYVQLYRSKLMMFAKYNGSVDVALFRGILVLHQFLRMVGFVGAWVGKPGTRNVWKEKITRSAACMGALLLEGSTR